MRTICHKSDIEPFGIVALAGALFWAQSAAAQESGTAPDPGSGQTAAWIDSALRWTVRAIKIVGIGAIVVGASAAILIYFFRIVRHGPDETEYHDLRSSLGRSILLGLEFLVAADIVNTVAIDPTLESVAVLAAVVLVRTFLSFALEVEITGQCPGRRVTIDAFAKRGFGAAR